MFDSANGPISDENDLLFCLGAALAALDDVARVETDVWADAAADLSHGRRLTEDVGVG